jgi:hypothetical protein
MQSPDLKSRNILDRIASLTGLPRLFPVLSEELPASDLQSLLLAVYQTRARSIRESYLLADKPLVQPSTVDARLLQLFDTIAFATAEQFEAVDLSPVCPFGTSFVLGGINPNNVLTSIRNVELLGDSTSPLAIECARRRKQHASTDIRLCASHRVVRLQPMDVPGFTPHFRLFALVSAGRDRGSHSFELQHLAEHIRFYLKFFRAAEGFHFAAPLIEISDLALTASLLESAGVSRDEGRQSIRAHNQASSTFLASRGITLPAAARSPVLDLVERMVFDPLRSEFPEAEFRFNNSRLEGIGYYPGLCLRISTTAPDGVRYPIVDGGLTDWTARLLQNKKERLLTTGMGSELACRKFKL